MNLVVSSVNMMESPHYNLLAEPAIVGRIMPAPTVYRNLQTIFSSSTNELRITGGGLKGAESVDFVFSPCLDFSYDIVSSLPLVSDEAILRLRDGFKWRNDIDGMGPLSVMSIDTGGGHRPVNGRSGVVVANIVADLDLPGKMFQYCIMAAAVTQIQSF